MERLLLDSRLMACYRVEEGMDEPVFITRLLARVHPGAGDGDLMKLALAVAGMQIHSLAAVRRADNCELYVLG